MKGERFMGRHKGYTSFQEEQCKQMLKNIDDCISYMEKHNLRICMSALADEMGVSRQALYANYVKLHLKEYKYFNKDLARDDDICAEDITQIAHERDRYKDINANLKEQIRKIKSELQQQKNENTILQMKYQRLLGDYQQNVSSKVIQLK